MSRQLTERQQKLLNVLFEEAGGDIITAKKLAGYSNASSTAEIIKGLKEDLQTHSKNLKDKVVKIKMQEAIKSINKFCGVNDKSDVVKDTYVVQTMRYLELLKELKKSGNKKQKVI